MARYIDADALINDMCGTCDGWCESFDTERCRNCAADCRCEWRKSIDEAPTIEARPVVRGEWLLNKDGSGTCKQCGWTAKDVWDEDGWQNFCGQCGADMRGEEDEDD